MAAVPKFGDWDTGNDTNLFTAKFEVARSERSTGSSKQGVSRSNERLGYGDGRGNERLGYGIDRGSRSGDRGGGRRIMNPNDPLENPDAFFGNRWIKASNMRHENNQHDSGYNNNSNSYSNSSSNRKRSNRYPAHLHSFPVVNGQLRSPRSSASPARNTAPPVRNAAPSSTSKHNRFKQPSPSATPPRARVNPSGISANRGRPALPKFGEWDEEAEGFTSVFMNATTEQTTQFGVDAVKMEVDDDVGRNYRHKKSYHSDGKGTHQSYFCGLFSRPHKRK